MLNSYGDINTDVSPLDNEPRNYQSLAEIKAKYYSGNANNGIKPSIDKARRSYDVIGKTSHCMSSKGTVMGKSSGAELNETYLATNGITHISSSDASDTSTITILGATISGGELTVEIQTKQLSGQTKVALDTPIARADRQFVSAGSDLVGDVFLYEDTAITNGVPDDKSKVHCMIEAGENVSMKAAQTVFKDEFLLITDIYAGVVNQTDETVYAELQVREPNGVFITYHHIVSGDGRTNSKVLEKRIIAPSNSDIRMVAKTVATNREVIAGFTALAATKLKGQ